MTASKFEQLEDQVKFMVAKFQDLTKQMEDQEKRVQNHFLSVVSLLKKVDVHQEATDKQAKDIEAVKQDSSQKSSSIEAMFSKFSDMIYSLTGKHESAREDIESIKYVVNKMIDGIGSIEEELVNFDSEKFAKSDDVKPLYTEIESSKQAISEGISGFQKGISDAFNLINQVKEDFSSLPSSIEDLDQRLSNTAKDVSSAIIDIANLKSVIDQKVQIISDQVDKKLEKAVSELPKPEIPSLDDAKKSMQSIVDPISMDAKNANLRSSNNETKITFLEKKIEQLQLLINQIQIKA